MTALETSLLRNIAALTPQTPIIWAYQVTQDENTRADALQVLVDAGFVQYEPSTDENEVAFSLTELGQSEASKPRPTVRVQIVKASRPNYWYAARIGEIFEVTPESPLTIHDADIWGYTTQDPRVKFPHSVAINKDDVIEL